MEAGRNPAGAGRRAVAGRNPGAADRRVGAGRSRRAVADRSPAAGLGAEAARNEHRVVRADVEKQVVHRQQEVQEARLPEDPGIILRRTVIDEVIVDKKKNG